MKVKKKNVYYCEYCNRHSLSPSLGIHEKHCTANPDRECRLCENKGVKEIIEKHRKYFYIRTIMKPSHLTGFTCEQVQVAYKKKFTLEDIKNEFDYFCPNCIFTVIRCLGLNRYYFDKKFEFDYKKELDEWWAMENERATEEAERATYC